MTHFNLKTLFAATLFAGAATLSVAPAHASFEGCMARNADYIGCWLSEKLDGDYIHGGQLDLTGEDTNRIDKLMSAGYMKIDAVKGEQQVGKVKGAQAMAKAKAEPSLAKAKSVESVAKGTHVQSCETGKILDMIEKKVAPADIAKSCYK